MRRKGLIGGNKYITPSTRSQYGSVKLNQFGNVTSGMMTKILSGLKALPSTPKGTKSRQKQTYFVMRLGGRGSETGIWTRKGGQLQKLFNVTDQPTYSPRLRWWSVAEKTIRNKFDGNFKRAFREAMRTTR